ncbi:hypothetical protein LEP1GSC202_2858 [Leptospira yanagawae serovar Saopaulo str. Sao Paulo = ATCC 700523]|uniref:Uncharacterized protein n=1 Tax=Leptospira yanagawae serovar Saopaulo str. Sao Paulo = ATCC 700523 TaxID=1249483 RepID=A0A5E8HBQ1_9LEPT|nr:hypothetical protein LEP1GSC202_2858 [Leptospira yanagawae serovar Saopaulo str. Sao Paulo = ATCC 700523]
MIQHQNLKKKSFFSPIVYNGTTDLGNFYIFKMWKISWKDCTKTSALTFFRP